MIAGKIQILAFALLGIALAGASGTALHFRTLARDQEALHHATELELQSIAQKLEAARSAPAPAVVETAPAAQVEASATGPDPVETEALKTRIQELEASLAAKDGALAMLRNSMTNRPPDPPRWGGRTNWLESLKTEDPKRYEEIMKQREETRRRVNEGFAKRAAHFLNKDNSQLTEEQTAQYNQMLDLLNNTWQLSEQLNNTAIPDDQRRELMGQMRDNMRELSPMLEDQRQREFYDIGKSIGYNDAEAENFVTYLNEVIDITSSRSIFHNMRGGGRPPDFNRQGGTPPPP
jgi:hypothetical protein